MKKDLVIKESKSGFTRESWLLDTARLALNTSKTAQLLWLSDEKCTGTAMQVETHTQHDFYSTITITLGLWVIPYHFNQSLDMTL